MGVLFKVDNVLSHTARASVCFFFVFAFIGVIIPYLAPYLASVGYNSTEIGIVLSLVGFARIVAPIFWDRVTRNFNSPREIALCVCVGSLVFLMILPFLQEKPSFYIIFFIFNFFWAGILPQIEVLAIKFSSERGVDYSKIRLWGSVGYIVLTTLSAWLISRYQGETFFYILILLDSLLVMSIFALNTGRRTIHHPIAIKNNNLFQGVEIHVGVFLLLTFLVQASHGPFYAFFVLYIKTLGWDTAWAGIMLSTGVLAEIAIFQIMGRFIGRYSLKWLLAVSLLLTGLRWVLFAGFADFALLLWVGVLLHGISFAAIHSLSMRWMSHYLPEHSQGKMQALYSGLGFGGGGALGAAVAGFLWNDGANAAGTFYFAAIMVLAALVIMPWMFRGIEQAKHSRLQHRTQNRTQNRIQDQDRMQRS